MSVFPYAVIAVFYNSISICAAKSVRIVTVVAIEVSACMGYLCLSACMSCDHTVRYTRESLHVLWLLFLPNHAAQKEA